MKALRVKGRKRLKVVPYSHQGEFAGQSCLLRALSDTGQVISDTSIVGNSQKRTVDSGGEQGQMESEIVGTTQ